jgi:hypothetical protein
LKDGRTVEGWADERYRGGPENPLSDTDLEAKVRSCCEGLLNEGVQSTLIQTAGSVEKLRDASKLMELINSTSEHKNPGA